MATDLTRIGKKARQQPPLIVTSLCHHISDGDNLRACYETLAAHKATGVDGVTKHEYGKQLEENRRDVSRRLKRNGYRPGPKRRSYIPKAGSAQGRPLSISNLEDKIVETAVKRTREPIFEAVFEDSSYGCRPRRDQHQCLDALGRTIQQKRISDGVEADIKACFDQVNHDWLSKFLRHKIGDERVIRLIIRMLKSGILEHGLAPATQRGTAQGSILSPLRSNITRHYVLDRWFSCRVSKQSRGEAYYFRFADDFLACFQYPDDAQHFRHRLGDRLEGFALSLAEDKTQCIEFGRFARKAAYKRDEKPKEFTFLGFTHYGGKTRDGHFKVKRRTRRKKLGQSLRKFTDWANNVHGILRKGERLRQARTRVVGDLNYYATTDNLERGHDYVYRTKRILFKWLNRKSQRKATTWRAFEQALLHVGWPMLRIRKDLNPFRRMEVY